MAKKRRQKQKRAVIRAQQKSHRPAQRLDIAIAALTKGDWMEAVQLGEAAQQAANDPNTLTRSLEVIAEARFRAASNAALPSKRLEHLDRALEAHPDEARLHYHRGLTLLHMGRYDEASQAFDVVAVSEPDRPSLRFLQQLAHLTAGEKPNAEDLSAAEQAQLSLLSALQNGADETELANQLEATGMPPELQQVWQMLIQMYLNSTSAPVTRLPTAVQGIESRFESGVLPYYVGVAAMRKGDEELARAAWRDTAKSLNSPWFLENRAALLRQRALLLAQEGHWQEVLDLSKMDLLADYEDTVLNETIGTAHFHLGYAAAGAGKWPEALKHLRQANGHLSDRRLAQDLALAEEASENWVKAAEAWREMVRRRPRKAEHPDYLSNEQVVAIWSHAADCYLHVDQTDEAITCMKNALKYAPDDLDISIKLVDTYRYEDRDEAAANELDRILEMHPDHVPALIRLGALAEEMWDRDPVPIWKRVLAIEPGNIEARDALAQIYIERARSQAPASIFARLVQRPVKERIKQLLLALEEVPNHPRLYIELGMAHIASNKNKEARGFFRKAFDAAPRDVEIVGLVLHELLHADGDDDVRELIPQVRQIPALLASFWIDQGERVLTCELGAERTTIFWDEAIELSQKGRGDDTKAYALMRIYDVCTSEEEDELAERIEARIRQEVAQSGAVEYVDAYHASQSSEPSGRNKALRLIRKAQRVAHKAKETGIEQKAEQIEALLSGRLDGIISLFERFGPEGLLNMLDDMDEEDLDEFKEFF